MTRVKKRLPGLKRHFDCIPCRKCIKCSVQWAEHLRSKNHEKGLLRHSLDHGIPLEEVRKMSFETIVSRSPDEELIEAFRSRGVSIPMSVKHVVHVQRVKKTLLIYEYEELQDSSLLVEDGIIVGLVILGFFDKNDSDKHYDTVFKLTRQSGIVVRSKKKKGGLMFMYGARICLGMFDRYRQTKKPPGVLNVEGKKPPSAEELDRIASFFASHVYAAMEKELPSWTAMFEKIVPMDVSTSLARLGRSPFTTMGATVNYWAGRHIDTSDVGFGVVTWFDDNHTNEPCQRTLFRLCDYGLSFVPRHGTIAIFKTGEIAHQTRRNAKYTQVGVALAIKKLILTASEKRMADLDFGGNNGDVETWI